MLLVRSMLVVAAVAARTERWNTVCSDNDFGALSLPVALDQLKASPDGCCLMRQRDGVPDRAAGARMTCSDGTTLEGTPRSPTQRARARARAALTLFQSCPFVSEP